MTSRHQRAHEAAGAAGVVGAAHGVGDCATSVGPVLALAAQNRRREKARIAARARRSQETNIIMDMAGELHTTQEKMRRLDKATIADITAVEEQYEKPPIPCFNTNSIFAHKTDEVDSHFLVIKEQNGRAAFVLKPDREIMDEDDLTHLAPQAGDSVSLEVEPLDEIVVDSSLFTLPHQRAHEAGAGAAAAGVVGAAHGVGDCATSVGPVLALAAQNKRKEKARIAARARRSQETNIIMDMAGELHITQEKMRRLDKATIVKLAIDYIKAFEILCRFRTLRSVCAEFAEYPEDNDDYDA